MEAGSTVTAGTQAPPPNGAPPNPVAIAAAATAISALPADLLEKIREAEKRDQTIRGLGKLIQKTQRRLEKAETEVAEATAERTKKMDARNVVAKELSDLHEELAGAALGRHTERLFPPGEDDKTDAKPAEKPAQAAQDDNAWRAVRLATLTPTIKPRVLSLLAANKPPLATMGDVGDWTNAPSRTHGGNNELTDVKGIGEKAAEEITAAMDRYWLEHPRVTKAADPAKQPKLTARAATEQELKDGKFTPETAAFQIGFYIPTSAPGGISKDDILNDRATYERAWAGIQAAVVDGKPDPKKASFSEEGWAVLQKCAAVMNQHHKITPAFSGDQFIGQSEVMAEVPTLLLIEVLRRAAGPWAYKLHLSIGSKTIDQSWTGTFDCKAHAAIAAADLVDEHLPTSKAKVSAAVRKNVKAIRLALDALDKQIVKNTGLTIDQIREGKGTDDAKWTANWEERDEEFSLISPAGKKMASVYKKKTVSGVLWHVWDEEGAGGENSAEKSIAKSMDAAEGAVLRWGKHGIKGQGEAHFTRPKPIKK